MESVTARGRREDGQMLVLFALALGVLLGFVAMSIDVGMILHERRSAQNAADAAALAGAQELPQSPSDAVGRALEWAEKNGYAGEDGATITVNTPYQGNPGAVEVIIEEETPFLFARALGLDSINVHARAVAKISQASVSGGGDAAFLVLDQHACRSFDKSGTNTLTITNGGAIVVDSDCNNTVNGALNKAGSGHLVADGGIFVFEDGTWTQSGSGTMTPDPAPMPSRIGDPLIGLTPPSLYGVPDPTSPDSGGTAATPDTKEVNSGNHTFHPGVYWGGIAIKSSANVTFEPGVYIFAGGGLSLTGSGTITGTGVFFYNTFDPENLSPNADGRCGVINLRGSAHFSFSAPTSGTYKDIILWQDSACTDVVTFEGSGGGGGAGSTGVIYVPTATFSLSGSGNIGSLQIIANSAKVTGVGDMTIDFIAFIDIPTDSVGQTKLVE